jgi:hypothetical protein
MGGVLLALWPAIRPYSDETSLQGALAFASSAWILAHLFGMIGLILVPLGLLGLRTALAETPAERTAFVAAVVSWFGAGLALPFMGAEAFGLHVIGQEAVRQQSTSVLALADEVRSGPGLIVFLIGLLLLGAAGVIAALAVWRSGMRPSWRGIPFALAFALYIPQFFGTQPIRIAHGALVAASCIWLAVAMWRRTVLSAQTGNR